MTEVLKFRSSEVRKPGSPEVLKSKLPKHKARKSGSLQVALIARKPTSHTGRHQHPQSDATQAVTNGRRPMPHTGHKRLLALIARSLIDIHRLMYAQRLPPEGSYPQGTHLKAHAPKAHARVHTTEGSRPKARTGPTSKQKTYTGPR
eukprot:gene3432-2177_t